LDPKIVTAFPPADLAVDRIADLLEFQLPTLAGRSAPSHQATEAHS
jgi:hypothetical protein